MPIMNTVVVGVLSLTIYLQLATRAATAASTIVSTADSPRLSTGLFKVVSDLESNGNSQISTGCFITSRSVTKGQRTSILERVLDAPAPEDTAKAVATSSGFALLQPSSSVHESALAASLCQRGTVLYYPDVTDLQRGEGLFDALAPVMERLLSTTTGSSPPKSSTLCVLVDTSDSIEDTRFALERAAATVLPTLIRDNDASPTTATTLEDIFAQVIYTTPEASVAAAATTRSLLPPSDILSHVAAIEASADALRLGTPAAAAATLPPSDLAVAQALTPLARLQLEKTLAFCRDACTAEDGSMKLVLEFGALCDAAVQQALDDVGLIHKAHWQSSMGKQIKANLLADLNAGLSDLFAAQLDMLRTASFDECKRGLSKLLVSPNLQSDMESVASKSMAAFAKASSKLASRSFAWSTTASKIQLARKLKDYVANRILTARATGKFRPLPRKGLTVGLHWLLPKPFGNDYRQEPWMVHATDNMVYVPKQKLSDVNPDDVAKGDWRDKIVPSPSGNDMLYMQ